MKQIAHKSLCALFVFLLSCVYTNNALFGKDKGSISLKQISETHQLRTVLNSPEKIILRGKGLNFIFKNSSRTFLVNNISFPLGFPCLLGHHASLSYIDYTTHILPFFVPKGKIPKQSIVIVIDPGHGGKDTGTIHSGIQEKIITLDISKKVAKMLSKHGYKVFLTRNTDTFVHLERRANFSNQHNATLFVSIHCNSAGSKTANGVEIFTLTPCGQPSHGKNFQPSCDLKIFANNKFDKSNLMLAYHVQKSIIQNAHALDRGVKHNRFSILRSLNCPGILVECGFLSNFNECKKLASDAYRQVLAESICRGILNFIN